MPGRFRERQDQYGGRRMSERRILDKTMKWGLYLEPQRPSLVLVLSL